MKADVDMIRIDVSSGSGAAVSNFEGMSALGYSRHLWR